jgi:hypothetical protein
VEKASEDVGSRVAFSVAGSQLTAAATGPPGPCRVKVELVTVEASSGSLKVAVAFAVAATAGAPSNGVTERTDGGVVSLPPDVEKTTSTQ